MGKRVGIFTTNSVDKIHPRIEMQIEMLERHGFDVELIRSRTKRESFFFELRNWFSLKYFKWGFISSNASKVSDFDIVHLYDYQLLPLAKIGKKAGKKVVYETLDDMVHLHFDALQKRIPLLRLFKGLIIRRRGEYERFIGNAYCDAVIVNSQNLIENFNKADLIFYASPLEGIQVQPFDSSKETAFLYLGKLTESKGAKEYQDLVAVYNLKLLFLGKAFDTEAKKLTQNDNVLSMGNFDAADLKLKLRELIATYNLVGLSIILPENKSYELQEANKDIDYLAMGMPFVGNDRKPTFDKIKAGAGVLFSDAEGLKALIENMNGLYDACNEQGGSIYKKYSKAEFERKLLEIYQTM